MTKKALLFRMSRWALVFAVCASRPAFGEQREQLLSRQGLDEETVRAFSPEFSGVVHVVRDNETLPPVVMGAADLRSGTPNTPDTEFFIGSLSKQFAAAAALRLAEKGALNVDAEVHTLVSGLKPLERDGKTCTLKLLLQQRCGLPRDPPRTLQGHLQSKDIAEDFVTALGKVSLEFAPGEDFLYSNWGYDLVGLIVQQVSKTPYEDFLRREFWNPLGMKRTGIWQKSHANTEGLARGQMYLFFGYADVGRWLQVSSAAISRMGASGCIYSTVVDLSTWNKALHTGKVLPEALYKLMITPGKAEGPGSENYGMGLVVEKKPWGEFVWHNGAVEPFGFNGFLGWVPSTKTTLAILSNRSLYRTDTTRLGMKLLGRLHGDRTPPTAEPFRPLFLLHWALPVLMVLAVPYALLAMGFLLWRGPTKGSVRWMADFCGNAVVLFIMLAVFREPRWFSTFGLIIFAITAASCRWRRSVLRAAPLLPKGWRVLIAPALGSLALLAIVYYLFGQQYLVACALACGVVAALVFFPRPRSRRTRASTARA